ncbi:MAG: methenyltetrahydrofolate cyclohydrolase [Solirubrobacteraceae bacterium]|jgi:formiminotetrahydrofolate cyclodeaminase|nr:methenyltetrahydrofolate cyclohydrolase [Solirubrobacteraceae bacterium]
MAGAGGGGGGDAGGGAGGSAGGGEAATGRARELRERALALADADLTSYAPVLEAARLPREDPGRADALRAALSEASTVPLAIAEAAAEVAELAADRAREGKRSLEGDATAGALLAEAATRAAARLVEINLAGAPDDERLARARDCAERAAAARRRALGE